MKILPCSFPCLAKQEEQNLDEFQFKNFHSESSSSIRSLSSQPSLPSVPSLTLSFHHHEQLPGAADHSCLATLKGHSSYIFSLSLSGKHLYTGSSNSNIRLWNRDPLEQQENQTTKIVAEGNSAVKSIVIKGEKLFSAHQDHKIRVWKMNGSTPDQKMKCISTLPTINDRCMNIFMRKNKKCIFVNHVDTVSALAVSSDGTCLYSASWDRSFKIWRISDFKCLESVQDAHEDAINSLVVSNDGVVYTGSADKKIKVWKFFEDDKKHRLVATLEKHISAVNALALSVDGSVLYSGACDRSIIVWEKDDGDDGGGGSGDGGFMVVAGALRGHSKAILCLCVVSDLVFSGSADKTVRVWRKGIGKSYVCLGVLEGHTKPVKCLVGIIDNGHFENSFLVYSGGLDCDIKIWRIGLPSI